MLVFHSDKVLFDMFSDRHIGPSIFLHQSKHSSIIMHKWRIIYRGIFSPDHNQAIVKLYTKAGLAREHVASVSFFPYDMLLCRLLQPAVKGTQTIGPKAYKLIWWRQFQTIGPETIMPLFLWNCDKLPLMLNFFLANNMHAVKEL